LKIEIVLKICQTKPLTLHINAILVPFFTDLLAAFSQQQRLGY